MSVLSGVSGTCTDLLMSTETKTLWICLNKKSAKHTCTCMWYHVPAIMLCSRTCMGFNGGISRSEMLPHNVNKIIVHVHVYLTFCKSYLFWGSLKGGA